MGKLSPVDRQIKRLEKIGGKLLGVEERKRFEEFLYGDGLAHARMLLHIKVKERLAEPGIDPCRTRELEAIEREIGSESIRL